MIKVFIIPVLLILLFFSLNSNVIAGRVVFGPDGNIIDENTPQQQQKRSKKRRVRLYKKQIIKHIKKVPLSKAFTKKNIIDPEAEAAAAAGYRIGQTVKIVGKTVYKLGKNPVTGNYILIGHGLGGRTFTNQFTTPETKRTKPDSFNKTDSFHEKSYGKKDASPKKGGRATTPEGFSAAYTHRFSKTNTLITKRLVKATGSSVFTGDDSVKNSEDIFYTEMHADMIRINYSLNDSLNLFVESGVSHAEFSDFNTIYGAGFDYKFYKTPDFSIVSLYFAFTGKYTAGSYSEEYKSQDGEQYLKEIDLSCIDAGIETGINFSKIDLYGGLLYSLYTEDTQRKPADSNSDYEMIKDTLEGQDAFGLKAGIRMKPSDTFNISIEGVAICRNSLSVSCEIFF